MTGQAYALHDFIDDLVANNIDLNDQLYAYLSAPDIRRLNEWLSRLDRVRSYAIKGNGAAARARRGKKSRLVGAILEKLTRTLLDGCKCITHDGNVRTTISEIDFRLKIEPLGYTLIPMFQAIGAHAIGEAKCYDSGIKTEWINEFVGVLQAHNSALGVLFVASPPKLLRSEHRTAIAIHAARGNQIIPFGLTQFKQVAAGENFLRVLTDQHMKAGSHSQISI